MDWEAYREDILYYRELVDWCDWHAFMHQRLIDRGMYIGGEGEDGNSAPLPELLESHESYVIGREFYEALAAAMQKRLDAISVSSLWRKPPPEPHAVREGGVTDMEIEKAREYPIDRLIEVTRANKARCINPQHDDKNPSMDVRNNFCYCYSCGYTGDAIDVARILWGVGFADAVKRLQ